MTSAELLQREATTAAVVLVVSGFISVTMRRHLILNLLGVSLAILGAALLICELSPERGRWTAAVFVLSASLVAPIGLVAMARWRAVRGSASRSTLQESGQDDRGV